MERPIIEFLATDKFCNIQTGSRELPGLVVNFYGDPVPTLQSGRVLSSLFGQALKNYDSGWVYLDLPGGELSFLGSTSTLSSFTVGLYLYMPESFSQDIPTAIVPHSMGDIELNTVEVKARIDLYSAVGYIRFYHVISEQSLVWEPQISQVPADGCMLRT